MLLVKKVTAVIASLTLVACGSLRNTKTTLRSEASGPVYSSVVDLANASTVVVIGTVGKKLRVVNDDGGVKGGTAVPTALFNLSVTRVLRGDLKVGQTLVLAMLDQSVSNDWETPPKFGDKLVMFLQRRDPGQVPGLGVADPVYVAASGDNAIFTVSGVRAISKSHTPIILRGPTPASISAEGPKLEVSIEELAVTVKG